MKKYPKIVLIQLSSLLRNIVRCSFPLDYPLVKRELPSLNPYENFSVKRYRSITLLWNDDILAWPQCYFWCLIKTSWQVMKVKKKRQKFNTDLVLDILKQAFSRPPWKTVPDFEQRNDVFWLTFLKDPSGCWIWA